MNNKIIRTEANVYRLTQATLGGKPLPLSAECVFGPEKGQVIFNLNKSRSRRAGILRNAVKLGLVS